MCNWARAAAWLLGCVVMGAHAQPTTNFAGIGRPATPAEVAAWDIDVRPDFKGLPAGRGSVAQGQVIWEAQCASCHGVFGESNEVFTPLVGGTTPDDVRTGRVARLNDPAFPGRTTFMKLATVSTLWDYIRRAMPWNAPKTLKTDEVYAVTAYMLNLADIVPEGFVLSDQTIAQVQQRLPNRAGMSTAHAMWPGELPGSTTRPDVRATACMKNCVAASPQVASRLPDFARDAHGNLADQNRLVGAQRGAQTAAMATVAIAATPNEPAAGLALAQQHNCLACHGVDGKGVGPSLREVASKYASRADRVTYLSQRIAAGGGGVWGAMAMPAQTLPGKDLQLIAQWLAELAPAATALGAGK
jgi:S-disulfanyl-L-cysteine oxidoreductase SoxD